MKNFSLTDEEVQELRVAHKSAKNKADAKNLNLMQYWSLYRQTYRDTMMNTAALKTKVNMTKKIEPYVLS